VASPPREEEETKRRPTPDPPTPTKPPRKQKRREDQEKAEGQVEAEHAAEALQALREHVLDTNETVTANPSTPQKEAQVQQSVQQGDVDEDEQLTQPQYVPPEGDRQEDAEEYTLTSSADVLGERYASMLAYSACPPHILTFAPLHIWWTQGRLEERELARHPNASWITRPMSHQGCSSLNHLRKGRTLRQ